MGAILDNLTDELRGPVERWLERYGDDAHSDQLAQLVACSEFAGTTILREKSWFLENVATFARPPVADQLKAFVAATAVSDANIDEIKSTLRRFRNRYMLHVLWREVFGLADLDETLASLSMLADRLLDAAACYAEKSLASRYGVVRNRERK